MPGTTVESEWFKNQIKKSKHPSMRALADAMTKLLGRQVDSSAVSRMLSGQREMQVREAWALSQLLQVSVSEIVTRLGFEVTRPECTIEIDPKGSTVGVKVVEFPGVKVKIKQVGKGAIDRD